MVVVAAKSYYFGVGGGVQSFENAIKADNLFDVSHVQKTSEDVMHLVTGTVMSSVSDARRVVQECVVAMSWLWSGGVLRYMLLKWLRVLC